MANDRVEQQLDSLKALRALGTTPDAVEALKKALRDKVNVVVAKAAQLCGELAIAELAPDLKDSFERLLDGKSKDQQCWGKNAIAQTLKDLGVQESTVFVKGIRHVQMEPVWGGSEDTAAVLRGTCAHALVQCTDLPRDEMLRYLLDALTDRVASVRMDAARAMEQMGGREVQLLLRLKARVGDLDPRVTGEVLQAILQMEGAAALSFVAEFIDDSDEEVSDEAALAIGASRLPAGFLLLHNAFEVRGRRSEVALLRAMSVSRLPDALDFLIGLITKGRPREAEEALRALELQKGTEEIVKRVEMAVIESADPKLHTLFRERFQKQ